MYIPLAKQPNRDHLKTEVGNIGENKQTVRYGQHTRSRQTSAREQVECNHKTTGFKQKRRISHVYLSTI